MSSAPCGICGKPVLRTELGGFAEYHDCKPVPGAKLDACRKELSEALAMVKARKVTLPRLRHIKSRAVSDYTYSEHAEGWDDAVHEMAQWLDLVGIPYDEPQACTVETLRAAGVEVTP